MKKIRQWFRNLTLLWQIGILFCVIIIILTFVNVLIVYQNNLNVYVQERSEASMNLARYVAEKMEATEGMEWLISYWRENHGSMDIVYDSPEAVKERGKTFAEKYPQFPLENITESDIKKMSASAQKEFAEYSYMKFMEDFNRLKQTYHPTYLFCFDVQSDSELFYYLTGVEEGEERGDDRDDIYRLGTISQYSKEDYPVLNRTWETGMEQEELEESVKHGELSGYYHVYVPVKSGQKTLCLIGVTLETNTVRREIQRKIFFLEGIEIFCFLMTGLLLLALVQGVILRPVSRLQKGMLQYEDDKNPQGAAMNLRGIVSGNEIGKLAKGFRELTLEIERYVDDIRRYTTEQEWMKAELDLAAGIQLDMIPKEYPNRREIALAGSMEPAKAVGGDFFDFFFVDNNHLAIVIGDVSGKGIPAALFMVRSITVIRNFAMLGLPVDEVFIRTNEELCRSNESELFTTAWLGILEIDSGKLMFTEAGHDEPVCIRQTGKLEMLCPEKKKMVLGGMPDIKYVSTETELKPGETILLYTDGVPEANNETEELYGMERFLRSVQEHGGLAREDVRAFLGAIRKDVSAFVGEAEQFDDLTMLVLTNVGGGKTDVKNISGAYLHS